MDKQTIKNFVRWLETARDEDVNEHKRLVEERLPFLTSKEARADAVLALRLIDEELLARAEVRRVQRGKAEA